MEVFTGMISAFGFNYAPQNWALCAGQQMAVSQNAALFSLLSTFYGGDGQTTFKLPDLRGRHPIGYGLGPGLTDYPIGTNAGMETVTLTGSQVPLTAHSHNATFTPAGGGITVTGSGTAKISTAAPSAATPQLANGNTAWLANASAGLNLKGLYTTTEPAAGSVANLPVDLSLQASGGGGGTVTVAPAGQPAASPVDVRNPYLAINFCIALNGLYPSRN